MIYNIRFTEKAENDIDRIYKYICNEYQSEETAKNIIRGILNSIDSLEAFPFRCPSFRLDGRYKVLFFKSYNIIFEIESDSVTIISVLPSLFIN